MKSDTYDLVVVGSGPGGYVGAIRATQLGLKTAIIERAEVGGICLNWGCIPTKALLKSAELYAEMKRAQEFGLNASSITFDFGKVIQRSRQVAGRLSKGVEFLFKKNKIITFAGEARIINSSNVEVKDSSGVTNNLVSKNILLASGARPRSFPGIQIDGRRIITSREAMVLPELPKSLVIIGAGAIGVEFAYFFSTFGTEVTLIEMLPSILPLEDPELSAVVVKAFTKKGIRLLTSAPVREVEVKDEGVRVNVEVEGGVSEVDAEYALVAVGVQGNSDGFGLEDIGVKVEKSFVKVDDEYTTNVAGVYAIGDLIGPPLLAHVASAEAISAVEHIAGVAVPARVDYDNVPACTYCHPQVASLGLTEARARERGMEVKIGKFPFIANGRALALGDYEGFVKLVFDAANDQLIGAHIVGADATEVLAELGIARSMKAKGPNIFHTMHAHPTISEAVAEAAAAAWYESIHL